MPSVSLSVLSTVRFRVPAFHSVPRSLHLQNRTKRSESEVVEG